MVLLFSSLKSELEAVRHELKVDVGNARGEVSDSLHPD